MKKIALIAMVATVASIASAADYSWDKGSNTTWNVAEAWTPSGTPTVLDGTDNATIVNGECSASSKVIGGGSTVTVTGGVYNNTNGGDDNVINAGGTLDIQGGEVNYSGGDRAYIRGNINISGGVNTFSYPDWLSFGRQTADIGILNINGGTTTMSGGNSGVSIGGYQGRGMLNITGGELIVDAAGSKGFRIGDCEQGQVTHSAGKLSVINGADGSARLAIGTQERGTYAYDTKYTLSGLGEIVAGTLQIGETNGFFEAGQAGAGNFIMDGGTLTADSVVQEDGEFQLNAGTIILDGDQQTFIDDNAWVVLGGSTTYTVDYDTVNAGKTTIVAIPEPATLGLLVAAGSGLLVLRKRFMI